MTSNVLHDSLILLGLFVAGAFVGQFLSTCVARFPRHERLRNQLASLTQPWQICDRCSSTGTFVERLPILGWLISGGRCSKCRRKRSRAVPGVELLTACLFALLYWLEVTPDAISDSVLTSREGPPGPEAISDHLSPGVWLNLRYLLHILLVCGLIVATFIDFEHRIIPDGCTVPVMLFAIMFSFVVGQTFIVPLWFQDVSVARTLEPLLPPVVRPLAFQWNALPFAQQHPHWHGLLVSVAGLVVGAGSIWLVRLIGFWVMKQEAMGLGDVVLMAMIGSVIGWQPVLTVFFLAPMLAVFAAGTMWLTRRDREIPYGPWLSIATTILLLTWQHSWPFAKRIFDMGPILILMAAGMALSLAVILYFMQIGKRLLGLSPAGAQVEDIWSSADHLFYYDSERPEDQTGQWPRDNIWPGSRSGRGWSYHHRWRRGR